MKFGKTYMETIANPSFPKEWREGAIEYKHLKKLINGVVAELESLGLGADVLRELMEGGTAPEVEQQNAQDLVDASLRRNAASSQTSEEEDHSVGMGTEKGKGKPSRGGTRSAPPVKDPSLSISAHAQPSGKSKTPLSPLMEDMESKRKSGEETLRNSTSLLSMTLPQSAMDLVIDKTPPTPIESVDPLDKSSPILSGRTSSGSDPSTSDGLELSTSTSTSSVPPKFNPPQIPRSRSITSNSNSTSSLNGDTETYSVKSQLRPSGSSSSQSAAAEWVSSLADPDVGRRRKSRRRSSQNTSGSDEHHENIQSGIQSPPMDSSSDERVVTPERRRSSTAAKMNRTASDSAAAFNLRSTSSSRSSSGDRLNGFGSPRRSESGFETGLGRKDLAALRRRASEAGEGSHYSPPVSGTHSPRASEPSAGRHDWGGLAWRERNGPANEWRDDDGNKTTTTPFSRRNTAPPTVSQSQKAATTTKGGGWVQGKGGRRARAEYELGGTPEHPIPRIRLFIESPIHSDEEDGDSEGSDEDVDAAPIPFNTGRLRRKWASEDDSSDDEDDVPNIVEIPDSPRSSIAGTIREDRTRKHSGEEEVASLVGELRDLGMVSSTNGSKEPENVTSSSSRQSQEFAETSPRPEAPRSTSNQSSPDLSQDHQSRIRKREVVIPLSADTAFLDTLTNALANLSALQNSQREGFIADTNELCASVARVSSPYATKSDLYVWREIFSLWVEMQIFESEREKDRGELSVDESENRLKRFAEELAKRGWSAESLSKATGVGKEPSSSTGKGRFAKLRKSNSSSVSTKSTLPMKDSNSLSALENFLRLNMALLDVKKFQKVNVEAARKILKKHDKRTALTASSDLREFMAQQERARTATAAAAAGVGLSGLVNVDLGGSESLALVQQPGSSSLLGSSTGTHPSLAALLPTSTTGLLSESLPHILLSLLTTTLLPILPSIDDYSCAICTGVAWRPIRLNCSHLFCIRCLVKLQKKGKSDCPLCRFKDAVGSADGTNLDDAMLNFLKTWFPKEVEEKDNENETERRKEELQELGIDNDKCIIC